MLLVIFIELIFIIISWKNNAKFFPPKIELMLLIVFIELIKNS